VPISFRYDDRQNLLLTRAEGNLSLDDIQRHLEAEAKALRFGSRELFDATGASTKATADQVKQLVENLKVLGRDNAFGATAVVTDNDVFFGMARMLAILSELQDGPVIGVFRTMAEAIDWLSQATDPG
jgi:hypothetical protein